MKRFFDILVSLILLLLFFPVLSLIYLLVVLNLGSPVFFKQKRPGLNGKSFEMIKFRSMRNSIDEIGNALPDSERLTFFGVKLRTSSLDELPGLWSVFKGDMSLVGPRPLLLQYLSLYSEEQKRRHDVRPGITGWAQVNGRNAISWEDKFKYDIWYVENQSFWLDLKILILTVKKVLIKEGISAGNHVTMPFFTGSDNKENRSEK